MTTAQARMRSLARYSPALVPLVAAGGALVVGAIMILALGANPFEGYWALIEGAVGGSTELSNTVAKAVPLLLVGVGITVAFRANVINIGGEGQIIAGALAGTLLALTFPDWPTAILLPGVLIAGLAGGAVWGGVPGILKAYFGVNEILSTIMFNIVAVQLMNYALRGPLIDPIQALTTRIPQTERLSDAADLPVLVANTRLNLGAVIAVLVAIAIYFLLWRTPFGYRIRAVGLNPHASRYAGINVKRSVASALAISGALCGLTGAILVFGSESHRFVTDGSSFGFTGSAGFNGIVAALFGGLHPLGTIPASFLFGGLLVGANSMQRAIQVPAALIIAINGLVVVFVVSSALWKRRLEERATAATALAHELQTTAAAAETPEKEAET